MSFLDAIDPKMYYAATSQANIIRPAHDAFQSGKLWVDKLDEAAQIVTKGQGLEITTPWIFELIAFDRICLLWHKVFWMKYGLCPSQCHKCWKVVVIPETLEQLFALQKYQETLHLPSKCGIDKRNYTPHIYSGYWYSPLDQDLDYARKLYERVAKGVKEQVGDIKVILKRGCTEMEMGRGPSDQWEYTEQMAMKERLLMAAYPEEHFAASKFPQPIMIKMHVWQQWIEWAWEHGDETVHKYIQRPLCPPPVTYHDSDHKAENFLSKEETDDPDSGEMGQTEENLSHGISLI